MKKTIGFTLIELLIVVAIIGILIALVLGGVSMARNKARDNGVRNDIRQMRWLAEEVYDSQGADYTDWHLSANISERLQILLDDLDKQVNDENPSTYATKICATQRHSYCISAPLTANEADYYCVDASGVFVHTATPCPATCPPDGGAKLECVEN